MKYDQLPAKVSKEALRKHFKSTYKLGDDKIEILLASSAKSLTDSFEVLYGALKTNDFKQLHRMAHSIKGLLLNMGQHEWAEFAREMEMSAVDGKVMDYRGIIEKIQYGVEDIL